MKSAAILFVTTPFALLRDFLARLLRPTTLTKEQVEAIAGKGGNSIYFSDLWER